MCGIYAYIGNKNAYNQVQEGLKLLQYRGYDSCGIAFFDGNEFKINKAVGVLENLPTVSSNPKIAFGHTRWATHGAVNLINAHPHYSVEHEFTIVHNGVIKNTEQLKQNLQNAGISFYSQTDTEVIANLIYSLSGSIEDRLIQLLNILQGSYSLIVGTKHGDLYLIKKFSPLNILKQGKEILVSSDKASLPSGEIYTLKDNDIMEISKGKIKAINGELEFKEYHNSIERLNKGKYAHYMLKEIYETPLSIKNTYIGIKDQNFKPIFDGIKKITFIGCGTAYHSCLIGEQIFKADDMFETYNCLASNYECKKDIDLHHLHIIVSQSGETADCIKVAEQIKAHKGKILLITNENKSSLTHYADYCVFTNAEKEIAVASTKTYSCQVFVFEYMYNKLKDNYYTIDIDTLYNDISNFLDKLDVSNIVDLYLNDNKMIMIAKGFDYLILQEASLKIREIDYYYTLPMYAGELKHGTLSLVDENTTILSINTNQDKNALKTAISEIESRKGKVIKVEDYLPKDITNKQYKAIYEILPFQLLSYQIAVKHNYNPDMPKNLAKSVTVE